MSRSEIAHWRPERESEVEELVRWASAEGAALEIAAGGTKRGLGRPVASTQVLDMSGLSGVIAYEPEELVLTVAAGAALAEIDAALGGRGQMLAFEPPDLGPLFGLPAGGGTLGGVMAANLSGSRRPRAGAARDHILGCRAVSGRGETFYSGGRVVKNVTGYDLPKLLAGSHGGLAAMTEITVKVLPAPETVRTILLLGLTGSQAMEAMALALGGGCEVSGAAHLPGAIAAGLPMIALSDVSITALRIEGFRAPVDDRVGMLRAILAGRGEIDVLEPEASAALWRSLSDVSPFLTPSEILWRLSVPPHEGAAVTARIEAALPMATNPRVYYDWGGGLIWLALAGTRAHAAAVRQAIGSAGGHATLIRAPAEVRETEAVFQPQPPALEALTRRVKAQFDPNRILNPGRMYEGV